jgi:hypothetical protein
MRQYPAKAKDSNEVGNENLPSSYPSRSANQNLQGLGNDYAYTYAANIHVDRPYKIPRVVMSPCFVL